MTQVLKFLASIGCRMGIYNRLKNKLTRYHSYAVTEKSAETSQNSSDSGNYCSSDSKLSSSICIPTGCNSISSHRDSASFDCYYYDYNIISGGIRFFIEAKQRHYKVLNNTFRNLSNIVLKEIERKDTIFKAYENTLPVNEYKYEDALLHLKEKDAKNLYNDVQNYSRLILSINDIIDTTNNKIVNETNEKMSQAGLDYESSDNSDSVSNIRQWVGHYLQQAYKANDMDEYILKLDPNLWGARVSDGEKEIIKNVLNDHDIIEKLHELKEKDSELKNLLNQITQISELGHR